MCGASRINKATRCRDKTSPIPKLDFSQVTEKCVDCVRHILSPKPSAFGQKSLPWALGAIWTLSHEPWVGKNSGNAD